MVTKTAAAAAAAKETHRDEQKRQSAAATETIPAEAVARSRSPETGDGRNGPTDDRVDQQTRGHRQAERLRGVVHDDGDRRTAAAPVGAGTVHQNRDAERVPPGIVHLMMNRRRPRPGHRACTRRQPPS